MTVLEDRVLKVEENVSTIEKNLAVHLTECTGRHKALGLALTDVQNNLNKHILDTIAYREKAEKTGNQIKQTLIYGFLGLLAAVVLGPDNGLKIITALLKGG